jgi:threonine dehydratase
VIAGQGTAGAEIVEDCQARGIDPQVVVIPCSGGGLTAGITLAVTEKFPGARIFTAEPEGFDDYARSLESGKPERNARPYGSISDALLVPDPGPVGFAINKERLAGGLVASDPETLVAVGLAFDELRLVLEPGGAIGLAALLAGRLDIKGRTVVIVLSGGNIGDEMLADGIRAYRSSGGASASP